MVDSPESNDAKKLERSPKYPFIALGKAVERAKEFYAQEKRNVANPNIAVAHWGYSEKSSGGKQTLAALRSYGLLENSGGGVKLSDRGFRIVVDERPDSPDRPGLLREAALAPPINARLWQRYGADLPSDANLKHTMVMQDGFTPSAAEDFVGKYRETLTFAGLVKPAKMSPEPEKEIENSDQEARVEVQETGRQQQPTPRYQFSHMTTAAPPAEGNLMLQVPFRGSVLTVRIESQGQRLTREHVAKVRSFLELAEGDLDPPKARMDEEVETGEAIDLSDCVRTPEGFYVVPSERAPEEGATRDYCDLKQRVWIWSIGRHRETRVIHASTDGRLYQNPAYECLWLR